MLLTNAEVGYMTAMAAIHAHEKADFEKAAAQVQNMWFGVQANIPYLTGGKTSVDVMKEERDAAVARYKKWKLQEKNPAGHENLVPRDNTE